MLSVRTDVAGVDRFLTDLERRKVPFATRRALKDTASDNAFQTMPAILPKIFDRPSRWTLRGFSAYQPRGKLLDAYVNIKDGGTRLPGSGGRIGTPAFKYLRVQIRGGGRGEKSTEKKLRIMGMLGDDEFIVPGKDMRLNRYGNLSGATYSKILADVQNQAFGIAQGFGQRTTRRGKKDYFYDPNLRPRGIYRRTSRNRLIVALLFIQAPRYAPRFDFEGITARAARKRFPRNWRRRMQQAIATAKR